MATKKTATKKAATPAKKAASTKGGIVQQIFALCKKGKTQQQIIALGFNKSTVYRQHLVFRNNKLQTA